MKAYFYKLTTINKNDSSFDQCLFALNPTFSNKGSYVQCDTTSLRIENYKREGSYCTGDIIRQQKDDLPPIANDGSDLEPNTNPLGHRTAFLYDYSTQVLAYQVNKNGVGVGIFMKCLSEQLPHNGFMHDPVVSVDQIVDILKKGARKMYVKFAGLDNLAAIEDIKDTDLQNLENFRKMFDAPSIEVTCGFDTSAAGSMNTEAIAKLARSYYNAPVNHKKFQVKQEGSDELLDLLGKKLSYTDHTVKLDMKNIQGHYSARKAFLVNALTAHRTTLDTLFKVA